MKLPITKKLFLGAGGVAAVGLAYFIYLFQEAIPKIGGISIAYVIMASLLGGAAYALLAAVGVDFSNEAKENK